MTTNEKTIVLARIADAFGWDLIVDGDPEDPSTHPVYNLVDPELGDEEGRIEFDTIEDAAKHIYDLVLNMELDDLVNALTIPDDFRYCADNLYVIWKYDQISSEAFDIMEDPADEIVALASQAINDLLLETLEEIME